MRHMDRAAVRSRRISGFLTETLLSLSCTQPRARLKSFAPSLALRDLQPPRDDFFREAEFCTRDRGFCEIFGLP